MPPFSPIFFHSAINVMLRSTCISALWTPKCKVVSAFDVCRLLLSRKCFVHVHHNYWCLSCCTMHWIAGILLMEHQPGLDSDCCFTYFHNICFHVLSCSLLEKRKTLFVVFNLAFTSRWGCMACCL
jgi:hypothetical protein